MCEVLPHGTVIDLSEAFRVCVCVVSFQQFVNISQFILNYCQSNG